MDRKKKLKINTVVSLINQFVVIIHGLILPRLYMGSYGSDVYGLVSSITQFLGVVSLMELGMGAVVQTALYTPLAKHDNVGISKIVKSSQNFFSKIALILVIYTLILTVVYPTIIGDEFGFIYEASLVVIIALSTVSEYFFGMTYRLLVSADQRAYINLSLQCACYVVNIIVCTFLIKMGFVIHIVKLVSVLIFVLKPIILMCYVRKNYSIDKNIQYKEEPIKQKWNGVAQHIAYYITQHTAIMVLTVLADLPSVAIYSVYNIVTNGISTMIYALSNGLQALIGNMIANKENERLARFFDVMEWFMHNIVVFLYVCVAVLIVPFVMVYTRGVTDANYYQPVFSVILVLASAIYCLRMPYNMVVFAAGHYKQTQVSSIIEAGLNIGLTIILVNKFGLVGAAIGTLVALTYRTLYLVQYSAKNIIKRSLSRFRKRLIIDLGLIALTLLSTSLVSVDATSYLGWIYSAIKVVIIVFVEIVAINFVAERNNMKYFIGKIGVRKQ